MNSRREFISPDGLLKLLVIREQGDITIGFAGCSWHTHGEVIAGELQLIGEDAISAEEAAERFVKDLLDGAIPIGVIRSQGDIKDVWASYLPNCDDPYQPRDEQLEIRRWDGTAWQVRE